MERESDSEFIKEIQKTVKKYYRYLDKSNNIDIEEIFKEK